MNETQANFYGGVILTAELPKLQSRLLIGHTLKFDSPDPMPNRFRRFFYWLLLGWRWERIES